MGTDKQTETNISGGSRALPKGMGEGGNKRGLGCECFSAQEEEGCSSEKSLHNILIVEFQEISILLPWKVSLFCTLPAHRKFQFSFILFF